MTDTYHEESGDHPQLEQCSKGDWVSYAQNLLTTAGYPPQDYKIDGLFGPMTKEAVRDYQGAHGLTVDGIIGPQTWAALEGQGGTGQLEFGTEPFIDDYGWLQWTVRNTGNGTVAANEPAGSYEMYEGSGTIPGSWVPLASDLGPGEESGQIAVNLVEWTPKDGDYQVSLQVGSTINYVDYVVKDERASKP